ncbi:MAG: Gfo/Idh/MocA family protein [Bryobacteraceae bacterium]
MDKIRIAFLGASHSHASDKIKVVQENSACELAGVCDDDPQVRARHSGIRFLTQRELLGDSTITAVAVESGVKEHARHARLALDAGKHVHLEKPPAETLAEFRELVSIAERKHLLMQMGYMWRYNPAINGALDAARQGRLGDVYLVRAQMNTLIGADRRPEWGLFHGGQMFEQGAHLIDIVVRLLGRPVKVTPFLRKHGAFSDDMRDNTVAVLEYPKALAVVSASTLQPNANAHRFFEILGSKGTAVVRPIEPPALAIDAGGALSQAKLPPYRRYVGEFAELASAIRERRPLADTPREDLLVQETVMRASEMPS